MNQILENLFSIDRVKRKVFLITRKGKRVAKKVNKVKNMNLVPIQSKSERDDIQLPDYILKMRAEKLTADNLVPYFEEVTEIPISNEEFEMKDVQIVKQEEIEKKDGLIQEVVTDDVGEKIEFNQETLKPKKKPTMIKPMSIRKKKSVKSENQEVE
jgi:hypothetical protein